MYYSSMKKLLYRSVFAAVCVVGAFAFSSPARAEDDSVMKELTSMMSKAGFYIGAPQKYSALKMIHGKDYDIELGSMADQATDMAYPVLINTRWGGKSNLSNKRYTYLLSTQTDTIYNNNKTLVFRDALSGQYTDRCDSSNTNLFKMSGWGFAK